MSRWAWVEVSADAIEHNVRRLVDAASPADVWAVVKANGYGHGAVTAARAALAGGATGLCVALVDEGVQLREAGIDAPILVLSEQPAESLGEAVRHRLQLTVYSVAAVDAIARAGGVEHPVHLKVDTGMHRVGVALPDAVAVADAIAASPATVLEGVFTHFAVADDPAHPSTDLQLARFDEARRALSAAGHHPRLVHAANSAAAMVHRGARFDLVRTGIATYGISPSPAVNVTCAELGLRPALSFHARVSFVKRLSAGESISYGLRHTFERDATVATVPVGYADGVPRRLWSVGGDVLVRGRRRAIVGVVTMDQLMIDCGDDEISVGDHVVLLGQQGGESIGAADWAARLDTIAYEIVCGISARVERRLV